MSSGIDHVFWAATYSGRSYVTNLIERCPMCRMKTLHYEAGTGLPDRNYTVWYCYACGALVKTYCTGERLTFRPMKRTWEIAIAGFTGAVTSALIVWWLR